MKILGEKIKGIEKVLISGNLSSTYGSQVKEFEYNLGDYLGIDFCIAVNSGTSALHTALLSLGVRKGDEVICPAWTFISTASAILMCGAKPVFADINRESFNLDPVDAENKITDKTKAIIVVHLAGIPANMNEFCDIGYYKGIKIIEDACQSLGAEFEKEKVGTLADVGVFSFYPSKIMTTGEGGMICTNNEYINRDCRLIRNHGQSKQYYSERLGFNYRMTEIQGVLGNIELKYIDEKIKKKTKLYNDFVETNKENFNGWSFPKIPNNVKIAPTYISTWCEREIKDKNFYTPLYKLPLFNQDIKLEWTEYTYKFGTRFLL